MLTLPVIHQQIRTCTNCDLSKTRINAVPGHGNPNAKIFIIGEAPGADEDAAGKPFIGKAGKNLEAALQSINLKREDVYISNTIKCRPPLNRDPTPTEIQACSNHLQNEIQTIKPKIIITLGRHAYEALSHDKPKKFYDITGKPIQKTDYLLIPFLHPASIIYRKIWAEKYFQDWQNIKPLL